ncbi:serine protease [Halobacteriovorax sp. HLS]|uniref:S1 family peptidase n=1 Tax=Halobacteriovorax sp. HLS TaxID=2234000 RepID=UPI000FDA3A0A|nr:serine protease [Halobacteriovorax sp. HLS]
MKFAVCTVLALLTMSSFAAPQKVVYGDDNRVLLSNSTNENFKTWAKATAAMIPSNKVRFPQLDDLYPDTIKVFSETLKESRNLCEGGKFAEQLTAANCSGFLVKEGGVQYIVTAGHCMRAQSDCDSNVWAFGYDSSVSVEAPFLATQNVYKCAEIVDTKLSNISDNDYAVVRLDREVEGVTPLEFRKEGKVSESTELVVIGHPSGLPTIINDKGTIRENDNDFYFVANLDTFGGNSGSAVLDAETGLVEGILVRGEDDYEWVSLDENQSCYRPLVCEEGKCRGEDVTRITNISILTGKEAPFEEEEASYDRNYPRYSPWIDPDHDYDPYPWEFDFNDLY